MTARVVSTSPTRIVASVAPLSVAARISNLPSSVTEISATDSSMLVSTSAVSIGAVNPSVS